MAWKSRGRGSRFARVLLVAALAIAVLPSLIPESAKTMSAPLPLRHPEKLAAAVMLALEASFTLQSRTASRTVAAAEFFQGLFLTALAPGELLVGITIPRAAGARASAFDEVSRRHGDFALAGAAAHVAVNGDGSLTALPGIGEWTAQLVAMRVLAWPDAFVASDIGVLKALGHRQAKLAQEQSQAWKPWRSYAVMQLWQSLESGT